MKPEHELLQFFAFAHLPPHLQAVSQPFCGLAHELAGLPESEFRDRAPVFVGELERRQSEVSAYSYNGANTEASVAVTKLHEAWKWSGSSTTFQPDHARLLDKVLRLVLEAKDCAVRAVLYKAPVSSDEGEDEVNP